MMRSALRLATIVTLLFMYEGYSVALAASGHVAGIAPPAMYPQETWQGRSEVILRVLNRLDSHVEYITIPVGKEVAYRSIEIRALACVERPITLPEDRAVHLRIKEKIADNVPIYEGWMIASSPALGVYGSSLYDVQVVSCQGKNVEPQPGDLPKTKAPVLSVVEPQRVDADNIHPPIIPESGQSGGGPMSLLPPSIGNH